jgi:hypothetical protein
VTERDSQPDPVGDLQRWLMRSGARGLSRDLTGQIRRALGQEPRRSDVWDAATAPPADEAPECAWCPVCRAARMLRQSRQGGLGTHIAGAGDTLASVVQEAYSAFEAAMKAPQQHRHEPPAGRPAPDPWKDADPWADAADRAEDDGRAPDDRR